MLTHDVPTILNYEQANKHCENTRPIRATNKIPLGARRYYNDRHLIKADDGSIEVHSWNHKIVSYYPDGKIEFHSLSYTSDRQIIYALFREYLITKYGNAHKHYLCDVKSGITYPMSYDEKEGRYKPLEFKWLGYDKGYELIGERELEEKMYVKRKELSSVRKEYESLITYCLTMNKLAGGEYERDREWKPTHDIHDRIKELRGQGFTDDNQEKFTCVYDQVIAGLTNNWYYKAKVTDKDINNYFTDWIKNAYTDEVMEWKEVPATKIVK